MTDKSANTTTVLQPDDHGGYSIASGARADIQRIDISDVDLLITMKNGDHFLLPGGGIAAMGDHPPAISFADSTVSTTALLSEVGAALDIASTTPMPASFKIEGGKDGANGKEHELAQHVQKLEQEVKQQQQKIEQQQKQIEQQKHAQAACDDKSGNQDQKDGCTPHKDDNQQVAPLNLNTSTALEQMVQDLKNIENQLHNKDYDYTPPNQYSVPPSAPTPPPGVPPPISLTPIVTLFMGNVVGTTSEAINGINYYYGGGGALNSDAAANIGPRDALQWSAATITGDNSNDVIYAEGPLVGNTAVDPGMINTAYYAKEFLLNVAGYFTTLNNITIKDVPAGVSIVGATSEGGGMWILPSSYVLKQNTFTIVYNTASYVAGGNNTFTIEFDVSGTTTRNSNFNSVQTVEFEYMPVTNSSQITDPTLVYDSGGYTKEVYVLPTLGQPNIITAGNGNDTVYGSPSNDSITLGNGNDTVTEGSGNDVIATGSGNSAITAGNGNDTVTVGDGLNTITLGNGNNNVTVGAGGDTISLGAGNNTILVNSTSGDTSEYTITATATSAKAVNSVTGGDGDYTISLGTGTNTVSIGNSTSIGDGVTTFDTTISLGAGTNSVTTGGGVHDITVGIGASAITTGAGNNLITTAGGGGTVSVGAGNDTININSTTGSTDLYKITGAGGVDTINAGDDNYNITMGAGTNTVTLGNGTTSYNSQVTLGAGTNTVATGNGLHTINVGAGTSTITTGSGNDSITTAGGGGTINAGGGNNSITINSTGGSTNLYTLTATGSGTDTITGGDDNYNITTATGADTISTGAGTDSITTTGGGGTITTGLGADTINVGTGNYTITAAGGGGTITTGSGSNAITTTGTGNYTITTAGGGGTISTGQGNQTIQINSTGGSANSQRITTSGTGTSNITAGDNNYTITAGSTGANTISIGSGTSTITATAGTGVASITTGNGAMTIAAGAGAGDTITIGSGTTVANRITASLGNGAGDSVTTNGSAASTGTIAIGTGNNDTATIGSGNFTITVGGANGVTNPMNLTSGSGDSITAGSGNNTLYLGSHASGTDTVTLGNGNNTVYVGTGTDTLTAGSGSNTLNFSNLTSALTVAFGTTGTGTATATGVSDSFTGFTTIYTTNNGDTITLNTGNLNVYAGSGNDTITLGSGTDNVNAGNGNNTITGTNLTTTTGDYLYGGTGNNIYTNPDAGTTYNGTNGVALTAAVNNLAYSFTNTTGTNPFAGAGTLPADLKYTYSGGVATVSLYLQTQINEVSYAASAAGNLGINLAIGAGIGTGGAAAGSVYAFGPSPGYSTIDAVIGNGWGDSLTPSYDNTILLSASSSSVGGGDANFYDGSTLATQIVIDVGVNTGGSNGGLNDFFYMGPATEIIVGNKVDGNWVDYGNWNGSPANSANSAGAVVNLDSISHSFISTALGASTLTIAAYSGSNWGADQVTSGNAYGFNTGSNSLSWSAGDYFVPVNGTSTNVTALFGSNAFVNLIYGGVNYMTYYAGGSGNFFYAGSGGSQYQMNAGYGVADVLTAGGTNIFATHNDAYNDSNYNMYVILNKSLDTGAQSAKDATVNLTFGGTTFTGFAYGWYNVTTPVGNALTYISGYEDVVGFDGNDYFVGDNNNDQFNPAGGSNTIILGKGTNIVTAIEGSDTITSSSASGQTIGNNTLNFETANNGYSGVIASYGNGEINTSVEAFLNYSGTAQSTFFSAGGDETAFFGSSTLASAYQARTGTSSFSYDSVQTGIISTLNGSDYSSGSTNSATSGSSFTYDNVYSGAQSIIGHAGADVFIDNIGTATETFNGSADTSNVYYITGAQIPDVQVTGGGTGVLDVLRIESATPANLSTLVSDSASFTGIDVIDLRSGTDTVSTGTTLITMGAGSTAKSNAFALSEANMESLTHVSSGGSATLILKLDSGDTFTATPASGTSIAHSSSSYFTDIYTYTNTSTNTHTTLDIHYGTG